MVEYGVYLANIAKLHQGIPGIAGEGMHPMGMTPIHLLPSILGADTKRLVALQPAQVAAFEGAQRDAVLEARILAQVVMALVPAKAEIPVYLSRGELVAQRLALLFK